MAFFAILDGSIFSHLKMPFLSISSFAIIEKIDSAMTSIIASLLAQKSSVGTSI
jgi:hypothetical protein